MTCCLHYGKNPAPEPSLFRLRWNRAGLPPVLENCCDTAAIPTPGAQAHGIERVSRQTNFWRGPFAGILALLTAHPITQETATKLDFFRITTPLQNVKILMLDFENLLFPPFLMPASKIRLLVRCYEFYITISEATSLRYSWPFPLHFAFCRSSYSVCLDT